MSRLPSIQEQAPAFTQTALFPNKDTTNLSLSNYLGKWVVFFWYPLDFTFVCPTEIIAFSDRAPEFEAINTQVIAASCDSHFTHLAWVNTPRGAGGLGDMKIPIVADFDKSVANSYGVLLPGGVPLRALFIISPTGQLRQITVNDLPVGRNVDEILRLVKAFQFTDTHGEVCPANWHPGDATMVADPEKSKEYFSATHGAAKSADSTAGTASIDSAAQFDSVTRGSGVSVIQYWAPWCRNCLKLAPGIQAMATELAGASFFKLNTIELEDVASNQQISALPTFQVFKNGALAGQYVGSDLAKLKAEIQKSL